MPWDPSSTPVSAWPRPPQRAEANEEQHFSGTRSGLRGAEILGGSVPGPGPALRALEAPFSVGTLVLPLPGSSQGTSQLSHLEDGC